jgi:glycosyltransferase involved in cell wall biosynthesis
MRRILIIADNVSSRFGGEAALPLHYFRVLRQRGDNVWLICHDRVRQELSAQFPNDIARRIFFAQDTWLHQALARAGSHLPDRISYITTGQLLRWSTQLEQRRIAQRLIRDEGIEVVHQPTPVSPKEPSLLFGLGAPVVIGPVNGGMRYPPAFRAMEGAASRWLMALASAASNGLNRLVPGKRRAALVLVANQRSETALPDLGRVPVRTLVENGVDLGLWSAPSASALPSSKPTVSFMFLGRLLRLKAVDMLIDAFAAASQQCNVSLTIVGDGDEAAPLRAQVERLALLGNEAFMPGKVFFAGWQPQDQAARMLARHDALLMPSLHDCGGAVVLEAMALGLPVAATNWGGMPDYIDERTGLLIEPQSRALLVDGFAQAMITLAGDAELRHRLGQAGRQKVIEQFDWERKVDTILTMFDEVIESTQRNTRSVNA